MTRILTTWNEGSLSDTDVGVWSDAVWFKRLWHHYASSVQDAESRLSEGEAARVAQDFYNHYAVYNVLLRLYEQCTNEEPGQVSKGTLFFALSIDHVTGDVLQQLMAKCTSRSLMREYDIQVSRASVREVSDKPNSAEAFFPFDKRSDSFRYSNAWKPVYRLILQE